jgi:hypothetical protein
MRFNFFLSLMIVLVTCLPVSAEYYQYIDKEGVLRFTDEISDVPSSQRLSVTPYKSTNTETGSSLENKQTIRRKAIRAQDEDQGYIVDPEPGEDNEAQGITTQEESADDQVEDQDQTEDQSGLEDQNQDEAQGLQEEQGDSEDQPATDEGIVTDEEVEKAPADKNWRVKAREKQKEIDAKKNELNQRYKGIEEEKAKLGPPPGKNASPAEKIDYNEKANKVNGKIVQYQTDYTNLEKEVQSFNEQLAKKMRK